MSAYDTPTDADVDADEDADEEEDANEDVDEDVVDDDGNNGAEGWIGKEWTLSPPSESTSEGSDGGTLATSFFISPGPPPVEDEPLALFSVWWRDWRIITEGDEAL